MATWQPVNYNLSEGYQLPRYGLTAAPIDVNQPGIGLSGAQGGTAAATNAAFEPSFMQRLTGYETPDGMQIAGIGELGLGAGQGLLNAYLGMRQYGLARRQFQEGQRQFDMNYDAQRRTTNARLEDRQRARITAGSTNQLSVADYMSRYGIQ